jgi:hypothetical protein
MTLSMFEVCRGFHPDDANYIPQGEGKTYWGILNRKWKLYIDESVPTGTLFIGSGDDKECTKLLICNFEVR